MRLNRNYYILLAIIVFAGLYSCEEDCLTTYDMVYYEPVYTTWDEIKAMIGSEDARAIKKPGKIFALGNYLFINEVNEGIHVIDNADPADPQNIKFINIPGSLDIAVASGRLYVDNYTDLITLEISDLDNVTELFRVGDVFSDDANGFWYGYEEDRVITGWELVETDYEFDCNDIVLFDGVFETAGGPVMNADAATQDVAGKAGSMARFALHFTNLYALNNFEIHVFNLANQLTLANTVDIQWGVETIFPSGNHLFIGANNGMHILDISDPLNPLHLSTYAHITSCDPVVVRDDLAYVTLRSGNDCQGFTNQLDVIDISDLSQPSLLKSYEMYNPHGLGLAGDLLFLCDGDEGLKVFDNEDHMDMQMIKHYGEIHAYDVIPFGTKLFMIGDGGFYQYDYSDIDNIHLISTIPVED